MKDLWIVAIALLGLALPSGAKQKDHQPLPFLQAHDVVLFQGDSITDGGRQRTGSDYNHIMGQDYGYILAAEIGSESPERELVFINRGNSGNRVPDLEARWEDDTIALHPQLLSILIGSTIRRPLARARSPPKSLRRTTTSCWRRLSLRCRR